MTRLWAALCAVATAQVSGADPLAPCRVAQDEAVVAIILHEPREPGGVGALMAIRADWEPPPPGTVPHVVLDHSSPDRLETGMGHFGLDPNTPSHCEFKRRVWATTPQLAQYPAD